MIKVGGIRRLIVPVELGYPNNDFNALGPKPNTFSVGLERIIKRSDILLRVACICLLLAFVRNKQLTSNVI